MQSKVHPTYKTKYRVANWAAYNRLFVDLSTRICAEDPAAYAGPALGGGLLGGRVLSAIPRTPDHPVPSSLDVQTTREDRWDRSGIVRGFWGWRGSGS